ncbi:hypothetical protein A3A49_00370 [Candidatus Curtissbacteria bacterium RIFCSPLOWO2_01_FULL_38_11b]|uniref:VWFA domain-containing protein n=1 Tax=Candidatus Curtissbacteria bacterium RIFCSPLOWO2_01_FULL_38_11b TaxID=1797725 RepID=A0A1F5H260_9BACT|nr:MAG: hypothetical protein A3A49_00370 [Candidatus Curtissbacteria bacterium RIFCSPLOWO2_01_FULL_38_11b]
MRTETETLAAHPPEKSHQIKPEAERLERRRLIAHLGRVFSRRYDIQVLPSRQKGLWACSLDLKVTPEIEKYITGERESLDDLPQEAFVPKQIIYDEPSAQEMSLDQITTLLHHEAGHAKYTDFRLMIEGQKQAKDEGHLPTSFWITFEGVEDPRVNSLEGEESPAIDRQIRINQAKDLQDRLTESPIGDRPKMVQFAYNSFNVWLHGEPITELEGTDVGEATNLARPLLEQYFTNTDVEQRKALQSQIWDIAKPLEKKDIEQEQKRQMAKQKGMKGQKGQQQSGQGAGEPGQTVSSQNGQGEIAPPSFPGGKQESGPTQVEEKEGEGGTDSSKSGQKPDNKGFLSRLRKAIFKDREEEPEQPQKEERKSKEEKIDLSQFTDEQMRQLQEALDSLTPEEKAELEKKAREEIDEVQKDWLKDKLSKLLKLKKNRQTGQYEVAPQLASEKTQKQAEEDYEEAVREVEAQEAEESAQEDEQRRQQEEVLRQLDAQRREKIEMQKAGFDPETERGKFLLYQALEDSMYAHVRNFRQAIEKVIPRKKESKYEPGYFSGPKFDRRELIKKAPLGNEQFWQRQVEVPTGEPRLFVGLLVDNTGSMQGEKAELARKVAIFFSKVNHDMNIPFMGVAFGTEAEVWKDFKEDFDDPSYRIKPRLIDATEGTAPRTNLYEGLKLTIEAMNDQRRRLKDCHGIIYIITDGEANLGLVGQELKDYIEENRGRLTFKAFGLSGDSGQKQQIQDYLNFYFGESNCAYPENFETLPDEAFRVLRTNLIQFQRFFS